jgi:signal transduction histidine kinase
MTERTSTSETIDSRTEARVRALNHDLVERIKELNCLYGISRLVEGGGSLDSILQGVADLMPPAWQYPEVTCACISLRRRRFETANFRETRWCQQEPISVGGRRVGFVAVYYLREEPFAYEGPFLKEERDLIHGIAERLGHIIESWTAEAELKKMYVRERKLTRRLQLEMQSRVDFTRQLVHELKTPLTSLLATSQLLAEETRGTRLEKLSSFVWDGAGSLNRRIDDLHDVIRGEIGKLRLDLRPLALGPLLVSFVEEIRVLAAQHGMDMELRLEDDLPQVSADPERVHQVLLNLINNACKYASTGKRITIRACHDGAQREVVVQVQDYGLGIPRERQRQIFRPGYQLADGAEPRGLGIGLALCKMLVELHGGRIWLESAVGQGSSFFFALPDRRRL